MVEENRAEVNFELVERLAEREEKDWDVLWPASPRAGKNPRDPQDMVIEAEGLRQQLKKRGHSDAELC
jgi:hypothetical protein